MKARTGESAGAETIMMKTVGRVENQCFCIERNCSHRIVISYVMTMVRENFYLFKYLTRLFISLFFARALASRTEQVYVRTLIIPFVARPTQYASKSRNQAQLSISYEHCTG